MRRTLTLLLLCLITLTRAQTWEKYIAPGLTYYSEYDDGIPRAINALHFDMHSNGVKVMPELGQMKVYNDDKFKGRSKVSELVKQTGAIAGVNASFFPYTGHPIGTMVRNGELISSPYPLRPSFGWGLNGATSFGNTTLTATYKVFGSAPVTIDSINDEAKGDSICLDTDTGAWALTKTGTGTCAIIKMARTPLQPNGHYEGEVLFLYTAVNKMPILGGNFALMGTGSKAALVGALHSGQRITIDVHSEGFDWERIQNCVCGGPYLLKNAQPAVDASQEGFNEDFTAKRHARTAIGRDTHGDIWLVVVDGKQAYSAGATLDEMAGIMSHLGCTDAINLDGGGSSTFDLFGVTFNRPSEGVEREIANAILFFDTKRQAVASQSAQRGPTPNSQEPAPTLQVAQSTAPLLSLLAPIQTQVGAKAQLAIKQADGNLLGSSEILWAASGSVWVDQGGMLHALKEGAATITAWVHGQLLTAQLTVSAAATPTP